MVAIPFCTGGVISVNAFSFLALSLIPHMGMISSKKWDSWAPKTTFVFVYFRFTFLHISSALQRVLSWSLPSSLPTTNMSSAIPNTFSSSLNITSTFLCNLSRAGDALNGSYLYLCLPDGHANVVKYDDFLLSLRLWPWSLHLEEISI